MDVRADLFVERFLAPVRDWCRAHGMMSGGHLNNEDTPENALGLGHGSLMRSFRAMDVPGVDVIWRQLFRNIRCKKRQNHIENMCSKQKEYMSVLYRLRRSCNWP